MKSNQNIILIALLAVIFLSAPISAQSIQSTLTDASDIVVARDGSGDFLTIQEAILAIPDDNPVRKVIFIKKINWIRDNNVKSFFNCKLISIPVVSFFFR